MSKSEHEISIRNSEEQCGLNFNLRTGEYDVCPQSMPKCEVRKRKKFSQIFETEEETTLIQAITCYQPKSNFKHKKFIIKTKKNKKETDNNLNKMC